jgi:hypothetical protein
MVDIFTGEKNEVKLSTIFIISEIINHSYHQYNYQPFLSVKLSTIFITSEIVNHSHHK